MYSSDQVRGSEERRIGIDLGGTKIEILMLDTVGREVLRRRIPSPRDDYRKTVLALRDLVAGVESAAGRARSIGIGIPGALSKRTGLVKNANSTWLIGHPLKADLETALGRPVRLQNDANCFAVSEAIDGAAAGAGVVFAVILGTGVGAGIALGGRAHDGPNAIAGEWGHNPLPWPTDDERPGAPCYCGRHGCIETFLSGPALERHYRERTGLALSAAEVAERATTGESVAEAVLSRYEDRLARGLAHVINVLDPDAIVLGGGLSNIERLYRTVPAALGRYVFSDAVDTRLLAPLHGDSSGVRGAAWLWYDADGGPG